jgi:hypothetical protein
MRKLVTLSVLALSVATVALSAREFSFPLAADSLKFAVIGDNGDGSRGEYDVGQQMAQARTGFPYELVVMLGDNMYGRQQPKDFVDKFERPFAAIRDAGVPFYAAIGNHDSPATLVYNGFNMAGQRYYTYARKNVRFFVLDTNILDRPQLAWLEENLSRAREPWKIPYFHHPLYSDGDRHGSNVELRVSLEPMFVKYGVSVVFAAHDHVYERTTPQKGIVHFVEGSGGRLRKGGLTPSAMTAASFDQDQTFMLVEISGNEMHFRAISRTGRIVDSGVIRRRPAT